MNLLEEGARPMPARFAGQRCYPEPGGESGEQGGVPVRQV